MRRELLLLVVAVFAAFALGVIVTVAYRTDNTISTANICGEVSVKYRFVAPNGTTVYVLEPKRATILGYTSVEYYVGDLKIGGDYIVVIDIAVEFTMTDMKNATVLFEITSGPGAYKSTYVQVTGGEGSITYTRTGSIEVGTVSEIFGDVPGTYTKEWGFNVSIGGIGLDGEYYTAYKEGTCSLTVTVEVTFKPEPSIEITSVSAKVGYEPHSTMSIVRLLGM